MCAKVYGLRVEVLVVLGREVPSLAVALCLGRRGCGMPSLLKGAVSACNRVQGLGFFKQLGQDKFLDLEFSVLAKHIRDHLQTKI